MEREMCSYLEWELTVDTSTMNQFEAMVKDFNGSGPRYVLSMFMKKPLPTLLSSNRPPISASPIPALTHTHSSTPPPPSTTPPYTSAKLFRRSFHHHQPL
jgi:hypothetical protein